MPPITEIRDLTNDELIELKAKGFQFANQTQFKHELQLAHDHLADKPEGTKISRKDWKQLLPNDVEPPRHSFIKIQGTIYALASDKEHHLLLLNEVPASWDDIPYDKAYVRVKNDLYYIDKINRDYSKFDLGSGDIDEFDQVTSTSSSSALLSPQALEAIEEIIDHTASRSILGAGGFGRVKHVVSATDTDSLVVKIQMTNNPLEAIVAHQQGLAKTESMSERTPTKAHRIYLMQDIPTNKEEGEPYKTSYIWQEDTKTLYYVNFKGKCRKVSDEQEELNPLITYFSNLDKKSQNLDASNDQKYIILTPTEREQLIDNPLNHSSDKKYYHVLYNKGQNLRKILSKKIPNTEWLVEKAIALCIAVNKLHKKYVHGDIKPDNILIDSKDKLSLADFGRALRVDSDQIPSGGTPAYSPQPRTGDLEADKEQLREYHEMLGLIGKDIFSLMRTLFLDGPRSARANSLFDSSIIYEIFRLQGTTAFLDITDIDAAVEYIIEEKLTACFMAAQMINDYYNLNIPEQQLQVDKVLQEQINKIFEGAQEDYQHAIHNMSKHTFMEQTLQLKLQELDENANQEIQQAIHLLAENPFTEKSIQNAIFRVKDDDYSLNNIFDQVIQNTQNELEKKVGVSKREFIREQIKINSLEYDPEKQQVTNDIEKLIKQKVHALEYQKQFFKTIKQENTQKVIRDYKEQIQDEDGNTPLHYAIKRKKPAIVKILLENLKTKDINTVNKKGNTPLHEAVRNQDLDIIKQLLLQNPRIDIPNNKGFSILPWAIAQQCGEDIIAELVAAVSKEQEYLKNKIIEQAEAAVRNDTPINETHQDYKDEIRKIREEHTEATTSPGIKV